RLVLPLLQNRHSPHSAVYSGITWSPGLTLVTPSPTSTTMPAPSWPSTAGNSPSGSSPERVNASVWQTPVWVMRISTSPLRGGSTSISTIFKGSPAAKATAARDFMARSPGNRTGNVSAAVSPWQPAMPEFNVARRCFALASSASDRMGYRMRAVFGSIGLWIAAWLLALLPSAVFADETLEGDHVRIGWLAPEAFGIGVETIGVYFQVDPHWHVYWRNPGDSGAAPKFKYTGNARFGDVLWPAPVRLPVAHLTNLGYEGDVAYLVEVTPEVGSGPLRISLDLEWLVCQEECIPGFGVLTLERPVEATSRWQAELQMLR